MTDAPKPAVSPSELEARYREAVRERFEHLRLQGLTPAGEALRPRLDEVYVELQVVAEVPEVRDDYSAAERRLLHERERQGAGEQEQEHELDGLRYRRWKQEARREQTRLPPRSVEAVLDASPTPALVLLGDPGSGKSTLLQFLALRASRSADRLPVFVPLAAYDECLRHGPIPLEEFLSIYPAKWHGLPGLAPVFQRALEEGRALVLLDGLDEVLSVETRRQVAEQVSGLMRRWGSGGNRFVLTSRFIGYREVRLAGEVPHFMLVDFGPEEVERFVHQWCQTLEREESARAQEQARALLEDVRDKPGVAHLASNPLLLTMLALMRRRQGPLASRRSELYAHYVRTLLDSWEHHRSGGARTRLPERPELEDVERKLMELALWMQRHRASGTASQADLSRLGLQDIQDIAGLVGERGRDAYGFLHLTFQEYFVGRALAREPWEERWELMRPHLHEPRWHEALRLCAGQLGLEGRTHEAEQLVEAVLENGSEHEDVLHRDLLLAMDLLAEDITRSEGMLGRMLARLGELRQSRVPTLYRRALAGGAQLMRLGYGPAAEQLLGWVRERTQLGETAWALADFLAEEPFALLRGEVLAWLEDTKLKGRGSVVIALGAAVGRSEEVRRAVLTRLGDEQDTVRGCAVRVLAAVADRDEPVRQALFERLGDSSHFVRVQVARALGAVMERNEQVRQTLLARLDDASWLVKFSVLEALKMRSERDEQVRQVLLARLENPSYPAELIDALAPAVSSDRRVREALLARLDDPERGARAARALGTVASRDAQVSEALLARLANADEEMWKADTVDGMYTEARRFNVEALGSAAVGDEKVRQALIARLGDRDAGVRKAAVEALSPAAANHEEVRRALLARLADDDSEVRLAAMGVLGPTAGSDEQVRRALLGQLDEEGFPTGQAVADALRDFSDSTPVVEWLSAHVGSNEPLRRALLSRLDDVHWQVRTTSIEALRNLSERDEQVRQALLHRIDDAHEAVRWDVVNAVGPQAAADGQVRQALLDRIDDRNSFLRWYIVKALGPLAGHDAPVREALLARFLSPADGDRDAIAVMLGAAAATDEHLRQALIDWLADEDAEGPPGSEGYRMKPHLAGPLVAALHAVVDWEPPVRRALLARYGARDQMLTDAAISALRAAAGLDTPSEQALLAGLDDPDSLARNDAIAALRAAADGHEHIRQALLTRLGDPKERVRQGAAQALNTLPLRDARVREALLVRLEDESSQVRSTALEVLGALTARDEQVRRALLARLEDTDPEVRKQAVLTLGTGAAVDEQVREALLLRLEDTSSSVRSTALQTLGALTEADERVRQAVLARLEDTESKVRAAAVLALKAVAARDARVRQALLARADDETGSVRRAAEEVLMGLMGGDAQVLQLLLARLEDKTLCRSDAVAQALGVVAGRDRQLRQTLLTRFGGEPFSIREALVRGLLESSCDDPEVEDLFLPWVGSRQGLSLAPLFARRATHGERLKARLVEALRHPEWRTRLGAAVALTSMPGGQPGLVPLLYSSLLEDRRDAGRWTGRLEACELLLNARNREVSAQALDCALRALDYGTEPWYDESETGPLRARAAAILGRLEPLYRQERVLRRLLRLSQEDREEAVREAAYHAVLRLLAAPVEPSRPV